MPTHSSEQPAPCSTSTAQCAFDHCDHILAGYAHHDFPDLSSRRFAPDTLSTTSLAIVSHPWPDIGASFPAVVAAVGRVLGAYCGSQDVLLAIADDGDKVLPVRVNWSQGQAWREVTSSLEGLIADPHWPRTHPNDLRRALNLTQKQSPALAVVSTAAIPLTLRQSFPLSVELDQRNARLSVAASERLCHPSQSKLFLAQVAALVDHGTANPEAPLSRTPALAPDLLSSLEQLSLDEQCKQYNLVPPANFATDYLTRRATEDPEGIAVRWYSDLSTDVPISHYTPETITNADLDRKANQLGRWLLQLGLQKGRSVAVCMKRDVLFHATFIGVLRAGGCYVPIEAELPPERQQFILKDSNAQLVLSTADMPCFSALGEQAIDVSSDSVQEAIQNQSDETLMVPELEDLSYLLYTSGTTGSPKGCLLTHKGLSGAIWAISQPCASAELEVSSKVNYLSLACKDHSWLADYAVAFDVHLAEILVPMAVGIPILAAPRSLLLADVPYYIKHLRVSHVGIVPSLIEATMNAVEEGEDSMYLRYVASGGEKMSEATIDKWASHPKARLENFYGPSEATIGCASRMMDKDTPRANIGRPFANVAAYVVDENMNIVLRGGTGELIVEGPLVGRGYLGRPDLTEKVFLKFPEDGTDRWAYRTGDLVRMMPDDTLEIIGRIDTQIKLRGVRIESEGISSILRRAASPTRVLDVMTVLAKHPALGAEQIVSFVAWDPSVPVATRRGGKPVLAEPPEGLLQRLRGASDSDLASYMRPSHIVPLTFIPLNVNGKADAKVLSALFLSLDMEALTDLMAAGSSSSSRTAEDAHGPSELELKVADVMKPYIKIPVAHFGPRTNLFECGMESLAVARFAADLRRTFRTRISPSQIMQAPVVHEIAALLELEPGGWGAVGDPQRENGQGTIESFTNAVQEEVDVGYAMDTVAAVFPPFPVQEGVLFRSANAPTMYVQHVLMRLDAGVSGARMREAWREVVGQHEMLRTVFHFGSELVQVVLRAEAVTPQFWEQTIADCNDAAFRQYFMDREAASIARELNTSVSQDPPVRLSLFCAEASCSTYMVLSVHHALYDGISLPVMLQDLERAYAQQPQLPSAALRDVLVQLSSVSLEQAQGFWSAYLADYPWQRHLNRAASSSMAELVEYPFSVPLSKLQAKAAERHVTLQALLMCAYGSLLGEHLYGHGDVVFGVIRSGRAIPVDDIDTTICPMITVVPARVRLSDPARALAVVQEDNARVSEYEHIPLSRIQKWVPGWDGSLFDTLFSISVKDKQSGKLWEVLESQNPEPDYVLAVEVVLDPEQDKATVHAAFTSSDIPSHLIDNIVGYLEEVALHIVESADWTAPRAQGSSLSSLTTFPSSHANGSSHEALKLDDADPQPPVRGEPSFSMPTHSPVQPAPSLTSTAQRAFDHHEHILAGYTYHDFPDLSSRRFAPDTLTTTSLALVSWPPTEIATSFPAFVAAVGRALGAYCGTQDILLAIADDGDKLLPVRLNWSQGQASWREVMASVAAAIADPHWPWTRPDDLRRALNLTQKQSPALAVVSTAAIPLTLRKSCPLSVELDQRNARLSVAASERLCHPSQSKLFLAQVAALVDHGTANPDAPLSRTPALAPDLLSSLEQLPSDERCKKYSLVPPVRFATDYLTRRATEDPEGIAVRWYPDLSTDVPISHYTPETITNADLERKANQLGRWLLQLGLQKGRSVAVCMKRDVLFHATFIGLLRAGGCYVPIEAELPPERQQFILKDSNAQLVLSTADIDSVQEAIQNQSDETFVVPELELDDLSYILYTSGTTGTPKGCMLTHKGLSGAIWSLGQTCASAELEASGRVGYLSIASVAFDVHISEILVPMAVGIPILAAPRSLLLEDVPYYIKNLCVSHVTIVPSLIEATMNAVEEGEDSMCLRYIGSGGEKMSDAIVDKWASHPKTRLANFYGPSEVTIGCVSRMMDKDTPRANIGRPCANVAAYVVDENMNIVLRGGTGELIVEGPLVGRGYLGRPDLTEKVFLKFPEDGTDRWAYRTGDLVRMIPDDTLEIIGRIDTQIKLRGVRIESEGISSILRHAAALTHVLDVMTFLAKHPALGVEQIVSFVAWDPSVPVGMRRGGKPALAEPPEGLLQRLRGASDSELASYMRPSHIIPLTFIPLNVNGKADAKVLSALFLGLDVEALTSLMAEGSGSSSMAGEDAHASSLTLSPSSHANGSPQEALKLDDVDPSVVLNICTIAAAFLRVDPGLVRAETSLLSMGLDSIKSVGLSRKFSGEGLRLSSAVIMRLATPVRMAAYMQQSCSTQRPEERLSPIEFEVECKRLADAVDVESIKLSPDDDVQVFPTSILQAGMLSQTLSSQGRLYVHLFPLRLTKDVGVARLRDAWTRALAMYDILRTSFHFLTGLGVWAQAVHSVSKVHWSEAHSINGGEENLVETLNPFLGNADEDAFREPPVFLHLFTSAASSASEEAPRLVLVMHHALYDGLSIAKLLHAVEELYRDTELAIPNGYHRLLPRLLWQEQNGTSFWANSLRGAHPVPLPKTTPRSDKTPSSSPAVHQFSLPIRVTESEVEKACRDAEVTPQCIGQTAFAKLLAMMTRSRDVVFGRVVSGRDVPGAEDAIGPMLNTVPCRVVLPSDGLRNRTLLKQVQDANVASMAWQHASLRAIQRELGVASLWDSLFVYQPRQESLETDRGAPWTFDFANLEEISIHYPLNLELHEADDGFVVQAACTADVADAQGLRELIERYAAIVSDLIQHLDEPWQHGLPEISFTASPDQDPPIDAKKLTTEDWDSRFDAFREILSTSTKVPSSKIHPGTHLAAIGVDSITAVQIVAKARRAGMRLTAADVVQSKTVGDILGKIKKVQGAAPAANGHTATTTVDISRGVWSTLLPSHLVDLVERVVTASAGMEWLMGMWQRSKGSRFQHVFGYRLPADVDARKLQNAWDKLLRRHAILRSTFVYSTKVEVPYVVVYRAEALKDTWSSETLNIQEDLIQQRMRDLVSDPPPITFPFTHALFLHSPQAAYLVLHLHHFQYDAWSLQLLVDDLSRLYAGQEPRSSNDLEGFLRSTLPNHEVEREQKKYWKAASLDNATLFPALTKKPNADGRSVYTDHAAISGARQLDQRARELSISLQSVFLACWARVQARHIGIDAPVFSLWHSGRTGDAEDLERLAVPCINVLPLSVPGAGIKDIINLARQIQEDLQARSAVVAQTRLVKVHEWAGLGDKPVSNVFINVVKIAPDLEQPTGGPPLLEIVDVPYWIPEISKDALEGVANMHITDLTQDDIMVEIVVVEKTDQVIVSIEFSDAILDQGIAKSLLGEWDVLVKQALDGRKK